MDNTDLARVAARRQICERESMNRVGGPLLHVQGMTAAQQRRFQRRVARGELTRIVPGIFMDAGKYRTMDYKNRWLASLTAHAALAPGSVVVGKAAARLHGLPLAYRERNPPLELGGVSRASHGRRAAVTYRALTHRLLDRVFDYQTSFGTVQVTDPVQTGLDLARWHSLEDAVVALDHGLQRKWFNQQQLLQALSQCGRIRGIARARQAAALATPHSESPRESELKMMMWRVGLPPPHQQATIFDETGEEIARLDFLFETIGLGVEYDGEGKYQGDFGEAPAPVMRREMDQQRRLLANGIVLVRMNRHSFRDGSGLREITRMHEHLTRRGYVAPTMRWTSPGLAWRQI